jgi:hypothetical protein
MKNNNSLLAVLVVLILTFSMGSSNAHHGFAAHFHSDRVLRLEGTVKQFDFINPHGYLYLETTDDSGKSVVYVCDLQARTQLLRRGADDTLFTVGETITAEVFPAKRDPYRCEFGTAHFADGSAFVMRSTGQARTQFASNKRITLKAEASRSLFGTWIRPGMHGDANGRGQRTGLDSITAEGIKARDAFDPLTEDHTIHCQSGSPIDNWGPPGLATSIRLENDKVYIYHESMDITRTIHLNLTEHPDAIEASDMGHSIGLRENNSLVIHTAGFKAGVLVASILHSAQMTLEERLTIIEETGDLLVSWAANDPVYYSEVLTGSQRLQSTEKKLIKYDCIPGEPNLPH